MDRLISQARGMMRDRFTVARVKARGDNPSLYLLQVHGRDVDFIARSNSSHSIGDDVVVLLEPSVHVPQIVSSSPWRVNYVATPATNNGEPWQAEDFQPSLDDAISSHPDVAANAAAAHSRLHSWTASADHADVTGSPADEDVFGYSSSAWQPLRLTVTLDGGTR